jgi:hypothetical protein
MSRAMRLAGAAVAVAWLAATLLEAVRALGDALDGLQYDGAGGDWWPE